MPTDELQATPARSAAEEVFVLGAGFSHAIASAMPLLKDLGPEVARRLESQSDLERFGHNLETWMDYLAERQPWLTASQNLRNQAQFLEVAAAIGEIVIEKQNLVLQDERPPEWLAALVRLWLQSRSTVISLNYDLLVEKATGYIVHRVNDGPGGTYPSLYPRGIVSIQLHSVPGGLSFGHEAISDPFTLIKLHGSLSWYRSNEPDVSGIAYEVHLDSYWRGDDPGRVASSAPGKVPLLAPPTAGKGSWLGHEYLRIQWARAVEALREASGVTFIGYSLPRTDATLRLALSDSISTKKIRVVDVSATVADRYEELFEKSQIETVIGPHAVIDFVNQITTGKR